jgi:hypothetical protein
MSTGSFQLFKQKASILSLEIVNSKLSIQAGLAATKSLSFSAIFILL